MNWIEVKIIFKPHDNVIVEELIADVFEEADTGGVSIERPDIEPVEGWDPGPVTKHKHYSVTGYIPSEIDAERKCSIIEKGINRLIKNGFHCELVYSRIADEDWSEKWKEYFRPEKLSDTIVVKPTWRQYVPENGEQIIEIDPGMAFGTGTHPTTSMCIQLIEKYIKPGDTFLDIGTGSGILMIAADKLGATTMTGTDIDDLAVETAGKNIQLNNIPTEKYKLIKGNLSESVNETFDFVAANILAEIIMGFLDDLYKVIKKKGLFVCSGILEEKADMVADKMKEKGFRILEIRKKDSWAAIAGMFSRET